MDLSTLLPNHRVYSFDNKDAWLEQRKRGIGGSEIGILLGVNPYETLEDFILYKTGKKVKKFSQKAMERMNYGSTQEVAILDMFKERYKVDALHLDNVIIVNPKCDILQASLDGLLLEGGKIAGILECKYVTETGAKAWADGVPLYYQAQVQLYMHVLGVDVAYVLALINNNLQVYCLDYSSFIGSLIEEVSIDFWRRYIDGSKN
jgi:putative phage-type endonuclease